MVKNTKGGSGHKKFGRKHVSAPSASASSNSVRMAVNEGEVYAVVQKCLGNNMFHCHCIDGVMRLGHIRGKFSWRGGRRDNNIVNGTWILVGIREWESSGKGAAGIGHCDLMEVYSETQKKTLMGSCSGVEWSVLMLHDPTNARKEKHGEDDVCFSTALDSDLADLLQQDNAPVKLASITEDDSAANDEVNVDDI